MCETCSDLIDSLIELRKAKGVTQLELAQASSLAQPAIARMERKGTVPQLDTLLKVADALGYRLEFVPQ